MSKFDQVKFWQVIFTVTGSDGIDSTLTRTFDPADYENAEVEFALFQEQVCNDPSFKNVHNRTLTRLERDQPIVGLST